MINLNLPIQSSRGEVTLIQVPTRVVRDLTIVGPFRVFDGLPGGCQLSLPFI